VLTFHRIDDNPTRITAQMDIDPDGFVENVADRAGRRAPHSWHGRDGRTTGGDPPDLVMR